MPHEFAIHLLESIRGSALRSRGLALAAGLAVGLASNLAAAQEARTSSEPAPLDLVFVIDNSGSMRTNDPEFITRQVVGEFAGRLEEGSRLAIVLFDDEARLIDPLAPPTDPATAHHWITSLALVDYSGQHTNSPAGVERAIYELKTNGRPEADKAIVFLTDGIVDTGDPQKDAEKKRWLTESLAVEGRRAGIRIFGIALSESADVELIQALALETEGEYFRVADARDIAPVFGRIRDLVSTPGPAPVSAPAASGRARGVMLLGAGGVLLLLLVAVPYLARKRRVAPRRGGYQGPIGAARVGSPEASRGLRRPPATLVDVQKISTEGVLPFSIESSRTTIGRDSSNDIVIPLDTVSSFHATLDWRDGYFYLEDHRSTNGCALNGKRIEQNRPVQLKSGDRIDFASHEFRFIIPDHEPRGRTVALGGSALPLEAWPQTPRVVVAEAPALHDSEASPGDRGAPPHSPHEHTDYGQAFDACLAAHLDRVRALGEPHRRFADEHFVPELLTALLRKANKLLDQSSESQSVEFGDLSRAGVHYTLCIVPDTMDGARSWYGEHFGGYANFLVEMLESWAGEDRECSMLCVLTFGLLPRPWVSLTVMPAREEEGGIEILSFEFLSERERRRALQLDISQVAELD